MELCPKSLVLPQVIIETITWYWLPQITNWVLLHKLREERSRSHSTSGSCVGLDWNVGVASLCMVPIITIISLVGLRSSEKLSKHLHQLLFPLAR